MFTGIIKKRGAIAGIRKSGGNLLVRVFMPPKWETKEGESIAVNGICSTVKKGERGMALFEYMPETLRKTTIRTWRMSEVLNLEKSLRIGDPLDGHLVTGHVDGVGKIQSIKKEGRSKVFFVNVQSSQPDRPFPVLFTSKGSVTVDGVSLTIVDAGDKWFSVALTPYTLSHTNLQRKKVDDVVNVEADIISKYLLRLVSNRIQPSIRRAQRGR